MIRLSITIPTYNRPEQLVRTIRSLFAGVVPELVEVVVIDNASPISAQRMIEQELSHAAPFIRFIRNNSNIGLAANLLRCIEHAKGEWTWLLSDDDCPLPGAIQQVLEEIRLASPENVLIKFNSANGGQVEDYGEINSIGELADRCVLPGFYSNLLFISSGVFRTSRMQANLQTGYHWGYTLAPHVAILLLCMTHGSTVRLVPRDVVEHGRADLEGQWNVTRLVTGFNALADIEGAEVFGKIAMPSIIQMYLGKRWLGRMLRVFLMENGRPVRFWQIHYLRLAAVCGGPLGWTIAQIAWVLPMFVTLFQLRRLLKRWIKPSSATGGLHRS